MQISKVRYTKQFEYHGLSEWIGASVTIEPGEDAKAALNTAKTLVEEFWAEISPQHNGKVVNKKETIKLLEIDAEYEELKKTLDSIEFREDAQAVLSRTAYRYTIEAKKIVDSKPLKNK